MPTNRQLQSRISDAETEAHRQRNRAELAEAGGVNTHAVAGQRDWRELFRGEERHLDYKAAMAWDDAGKATLLKHIIAMSNIRDGGTIVVGVRENASGAHEPESLTSAQLATFDPTPIVDYVNGYVQPGVRLQVCREDFDGHKLITLRVAEFDQSPNICTRPGPNHSFRRGQILVRTNAAQSRAIENEAEMNELLALALSKRSETLMRTMRQIIEGGASVEATDAKRRHDEDWSVQQASVLDRVHKTRESSAMFGGRIIPSTAVALPEQDQQRIMLVQRSTPSLGSYHYPWSSYDEQVLHAAFIEGVQTVHGYEHEWRLYDDGALLYWEGLAEDTVDLSTQMPPGSTGPYLLFPGVCYKVALTLLFAQRMYSELNFDGDLDVDFRWSDTKGRKLVFGDAWLWRPERFVCAEPSIAESVHVRLADLQSGWESVATKVLSRVLRLFQVHDPTRAIAEQLARVRKGQ